MYRFPFNGKYPLTQRFDEHPDWYKPFGLPAHEGVDWGMPVGTALVSICDAEIKEVVTDPMASAYGKHVRTVWTDETGQKWETIYAHLNDITVTAGQKVVCGEVIGYSGNTGRSTGPHLHFTIKKIGSLTPSVHGGIFAGMIDPLPLLSESAFQGNPPAPSVSTTSPSAPAPSVSTTSPSAPAPATTLQTSTAVNGITYRVVSRVGLNVRASHSTDGRLLLNLPQGTIFLADPATTAEEDGYLWRKLAAPQMINNVDVSQGWVAERQLPQIYAEVVGGVG